MRFDCPLVSSCSPERDAIGPANHTGAKPITVAGAVEKEEAAVLDAADQP